MDDVATSIDKEDASYAKRIEIKAPIELVFEAVSTLEGIGGWWDGSVSGDASEHGEIRFAVADSDDYALMKVDSVIFPTDVAWSVIEDSGYGGEWINTAILFHLEEDIDGSCALVLHHQGLTPALDCYSDCQSGWDHHLQNIRLKAEAASNTRT